jgi:hypothetical protein
VRKQVVAIDLRGDRRYFLLRKALDTVPKQVNGLPKREIET